jgi:inward rectifier potassium channel
MTKLTKEGEMFYKSYDLPLVRDRQVGMTRGWTVMHTIDERSPLYGLDADSVHAAELELGISLTGIDSVSTQAVHTVHQYMDTDIKYGYRLADTLTPLPGGDLLIDLGQFDEIVPDSTPRASVRP